MKGYKKLYLFLILIFSVFFMNGCMSSSSESLDKSFTEMGEDVKFILWEETD